MSMKMSMKWRPEEGWDAAEILEKVNIENPLFSHRYACEAGADAMLEAIRQQPSHASVDSRGRWYFIPDER